MIVGIFDNLARWRPGSKLFGFLKGPQGLLLNDHVELTKDIIVSEEPVVQCTAGPMPPAHIPGDPYPV